MRYRLFCTTSNRRLAASAATALFAIGFGTAALAQDLPKDKTCRSIIGAQLANVAKKGMQGQDKCHVTASKVSVESELCNQTDGFPFTIINGGLYDKQKNLTDSTLVSGASPKCIAGTTDEVLDNYPNGQTNETYDDIDTLLTTSADYTLGGADLDNDTVKTNCIKAISKARQNITNKMIAEANKCQKTKDSAATMVSPNPFSGLERLSPDCLAETPSLATVVSASTTLITAKCGTIAGYPSGSAVGSCSPLPTCVVESSKATGKNLALAEYPAKNCGPAATPAARTVHVTVNAPVGVNLGGIDVRIDYPKFQSGVPENGNDSAVQSAVINTPPSSFVNASDKDGHTDVSLAFGAAFNSGTLFDLKLDTCAALDLATCSTTTSKTCTLASECSQRCRNVNEGGSATSSNTFCTANSQCPANKCVGNAAACTTDGDCGGAGGGKCLLQECLCPTCLPKKCIGDNSACNLNADCTGPGEGGFCVPTETCVPRTQVCSQSQYQECGDTTVPDPACPAGEDCVTQGSLTKCTITNALDDSANEVDGVTCSINVTEP